MYPNQNQVFELQKNQVDALQAMGSTVFAAAEKLAALNLSTTRDLLNDGAAAAHNLLGAKDPQEVASIAGTAAQPAAEKLASYSRSAYGIATAANADLTRVFETQVAGKAFKRDVF